MERREPTAVPTADAAGLGADEQLRLDNELLQARPLAGSIHSLVPERSTHACLNRDADGCRRDGG
jgi:hypothetical protein